MIWKIRVHQMIILRNRRHHQMVLHQKPGHIHSGEKKYSIGNLLYKQFHGLNISSHSIILYFPRNFSSFRLPDTPSTSESGHSDSVFQTERYLSIKVLPDGLICLLNFQFNMLSSLIFRLEWYCWIIRLSQKWEFEFLNYLQNSKYFFAFFLNI